MSGRRKVLRERCYVSDTIRTAQKLLGKRLCRKTGGRLISGTIIEVEAYDGFRDKGSHASRGRTARNAPMFGLPGRWYVYFTYGMHWMLNMVTREEGYPAAVLIRGVEVEGKRIEGPARVTKYFKIDKHFNGARAIPKTGLWIEEGKASIPSRCIRKAARVGIAYAGPYWSRRRWRFFLERKQKPRP